MDESQIIKIIEQLELIRFKTPTKGNRTHNAGESFNLEMEKLCELCGIFKKDLENYLIPNVDFLENGKIGWDRFACRTKRIEYYINNNLFSLERITNEEKKAFRNVAKTRESTKVYPELAKHKKYDAEKFINQINDTEPELNAKRKVKMYEKELIRFHKEILTLPEGFSFSEDTKNRYKNILYNIDGIVKFEYQKHSLEASNYILRLEGEIHKIDKLRSKEPTTPFKSYSDLVRKLSPGILEKFIPSKVKKIQRDTSLNELIIKNSPNKNEIIIPNRITQKLKKIIDTN